jgi:quinohemoprotein ethanol dehydrogenase
MQAPKDGYFYVLDAASGELISAKPFTPVNWSTGIDMKTGRPIMNPKARYDVTGKGFIQLPSFAGGHSWHPMSYSPLTGLVYIPMIEFSYPFVYAPEDDNPMGQKLSISFAKSAAMLKDPKALHVNNGYLIAWDPVNQKEVWRVPHPGARSGGTSRLRAASCSRVTPRIWSLQRIVPIPARSCGGRGPRLGYSPVHRLSKSTVSST